MILGEYYTGNIYSINDVKQLDTNNMDQYLVGQKYQCRQGRLHQFFIK
jgi:hypothetical protein